MIFGEERFEINKNIFLNMQRVLFNRDLLVDCIFPLLSIFDVFSLLQTCKGIRETYARKYDMLQGSATLHMFKVRIFKALCGMYGVQNGYTIWNKLENSNVYLTGGFLLALINGDPIDVCQDVDLVVVSSTAGYFLHESIKLERKEFKRRFANDFNHELSSLDTTNGDVQFYEGGFAVDSYLLNGKKLQTIHLLNYGDELPKTTLERYVGRFDFQFCSNYFSSNNLICMHSNAIKQMFTLVITRSDIQYDRGWNTVTASELLNRMWERIQKYRKRGYVISLFNLMSLRVADVLRPHWIAFWQDKT